MTDPADEPRDAGLDPDLTRRTLLETTVAGVLAAHSGCVADDADVADARTPSGRSGFGLGGYGLGGYGVGERGSTSTPTPTETSTPTPTPTESPTPTPTPGTEGVTLALRPSAPSLRPGGTVTLDVVVEGVDAGVGSYELSVATGDVSAAVVTGASPEIGAAGEATVADDESSARLGAFGGDTADTGSVTVATVTLEGVATGRADVSLRVESVADEDGTPYSVATTAGATLTVREVPDVDGDGAPATDPDDDGLYEDVNSDGDVTPGDATVLFNAIFDEDPAVVDNPDLFDFSRDGTLAPGDATVLFEEAFEE